MEVLLNLVWLVVSLLLASWWIRAARTGWTRTGWGPFVALCLLLLILFPVISMTDDLMAMTSPAEIEHMVRRADVFSGPPAPDEPIGALGLPILLFAAPVWLFGSMIRLRPVSRAVRLLSDFVLTAGVRPPPVTT